MFAAAVWLLFTQGRCCRDVETGTSIATYKSNSSSRNGFCSLGRDYLLASQTGKGSLHFWSWHKVCQVMFAAEQREESCVNRFNLACIQECIVAYCEKCSAHTTHLRSMLMHAKVALHLLVCRTMYCSVPSLLNQCMPLLQQQMAHLLLEAERLVPSMFGPPAAASCCKVGLHTTRYRVVHRTLVPACCLVLGFQCLLHPCFPN